MAPDPHGPSGGRHAPVNHVAEEALKTQLSPADYEEHVALMAMAMDVDAIALAMRAVRDGQG